jgi:hypothetical protein
LEPARQDFGVKNAKILDIKQALTLGGRIRDAGRIRAV